MKTQVKLRDGDLIIHSEDDVEEVLDGNHDLRGTPQSSDMMRHVYRIPNVVLLQWLNEAWQRGHNIQYMSAEFEDLVTAKMNGRDYYKLRVDK